MTVLLALDLAGTAIFAYSGALAARSRGYHALGVIYIALLTAVGGGTLRSLLLQSPELFWLENGAYASVVLGAVVLSYVTVVRTNSFPFYLADSLSLAVFVSIGMLATLTQGHSVYAAFGMGALTGIGGGLIRDAITSQQPQALSDPAYPVMIIGAALGGVIALSLGYQMWTLSCLFVLLIVVVTSTWREHLPAVVGEFAGKDVNRSLIARSVKHPILKSSPLQPLQVFYRTGFRASVVLGLSVMVALHLFEPGAKNTVSAKMPDNQTIFTSERNLDYLVSAASWHLDNNNLSAASRFIQAADQFKPGQSAVLALKEKQQILMQCNEGIAAVRQALLAGEFDTADQLLTRLNTAIDAHSFDESGTVGVTLFALREEVTLKLLHNRYQTQPGSLANAAADRYLDNAYAHMDSGDLDAALQVINQARAAGVASGEISVISRKLSQLINNQQGLSDDELRYAEQRLRELGKAIELRNLDALTLLTVDNAEKQSMFKTLFDRYVEIEVRLSQISTEHKAVSATLTLENMRLPNGNLTYPSDDYGVIALNLELTKNGWSNIEW